MCPLEEGLGRGDCPSWAGGRWGLGRRGRLAVNEKPRLSWFP